MTADRRNKAAVWFRRVMWIGILANLALAIPTLLMPEQMMALSGVPPAAPLLWPQFAALLMILLSMFYMPAAVDPFRYRVVALMALVSRLVGVVFFVPQAPYRMLGLFDLVFLIPQAILLTLAGTRSSVAEHRSGARAL